MKSIGQINFEGYWTVSNDPQGWEGLDDQERQQCTASSRAVLAHAAAVIREKAETETRSWGARDEWRRVAILLESME